jgi:hypothetical protein
MPIFTAYDAVGVKEDVSDIITNISPRKTPFQDGIGNEKVTQKVYQWQEDSLRSANVNAQTDGFDASYITVAPTVMRSNNTQIFAEASQVSGSLDATSEYGRAKESAYQLAKSAAQVKRDFEVALVGLDQATAAGASTTTPRQTASYSRLITNNAVAVTGTPVIGNNVVFMGAGNTLTEQALLLALEECYLNGAEPNTVSVTPQNSLTVAAFAKAAGRFRTIVDADSESGKVVNAVDLYVSPYGEVKIILNRFQRNVPGAVSAATSGSITAVPLGQGIGTLTISGSNQSGTFQVGGYITGSGVPAGTYITNLGTGLGGAGTYGVNTTTVVTSQTISQTQVAHTLVYDTSMWSKQTLRPWFRQVLAQTGDSLKQMIVGEFGLKHKNFLASNLIVDYLANATNGF